MHTQAGGTAQGEGEVDSRAEQGARHGACAQDPGKMT